MFMDPCMLNIGYFHNSPFPIWRKNCHTFPPQEFGLRDLLPLHTAQIPMPNRLAEACNKGRLPNEQIFLKKLSVLGSMCMWMMDKW